MQVPLLLDGISQRPAQHVAIAMRIIRGALSLLEPVPGGGPTALRLRGVAPAAGAASTSETALARLLPTTRADLDTLLDAALVLLLYQRPSDGGRAATPLSAATAAATAASRGGEGSVSVAGVRPPRRPPGGLSAADTTLLEVKGVPSQEELTAQKLGLLNALAAAAVAGAGTAGVATKVTASARQGAATAPVTGATVATELSAPASGEMQLDTDESPSLDTDAPAAVLAVDDLVPLLLAAASDPYDAVAR